ncbi:hypothetical protein E4U14_003267 [Claviceps sp. LM454 group G7]|nr:hypothetical protein E4U14_003267 [Claviceps sp. LM454 group G7]
MGVTESFSMKSLDSPYDARLKHAIGSQQLHPMVCDITIGSPADRKRHNQPVIENPQRETKRVGPRAYR